MCLILIDMKWTMHITSHITHMTRSDRISLSFPKWTSFEKVWKEWNGVKKDALQKQQNKNFANHKSSHAKTRNKCISSFYCLKQHIYFITFYIYFLNFSNFDMQKRGSQIFRLLSHTRIYKILFFGLDLIHASLWFIFITPSDQYFSLK